MADEEIELRTYRAFAKRDLLNEAAWGRMLAGLSTRQYPVGLEPIGQVEALGTSKSAISQRFIHGTEQKLAELFGYGLRSPWAALVEALATTTHGLELSGRPAPGASPPGSRGGRARSPSGLQPDQPERTGTKTGRVAGSSLGLGSCERRPFLYACCSR